MNDRISQLKVWMEADEDEHIEFKEAKQRYDFEELVKYCVALANERGGKIILGVADRMPRRVVGTNAFLDFERTKEGIIDRIHLRVDAEEIIHRAIVFQ